MNPNVSKYVSELHDISLSLWTQSYVSLWMRITKWFSCSLLFKNLGVMNKKFYHQLGQLYGCGVIKIKYNIITYGCRENISCFKLQYVILEVINIQVVCSTPSGGSWIHDATGFYGSTWIFIFSFIPFNICHGQNTFLYFKFIFFFSVKYHPMWCYHFHIPRLFYGCVNIQGWNTQKETRVWCYDI